MKLQAFSVFDAAANMFLEPFWAPTMEVALRGFREACQKEGHQFNKFPGDYQLFHVGEFDQETGECTAMAPRSCGVALSFVDPVGVKKLEVSHG